MPVSKTTPADGTEPHPSNLGTTELPNSPSKSPNQPAPRERPSEATEMRCLAGRPSADGNEPHRIILGASK
eukprot:12105575-Karenia_brevis.AAC.1